MQTTDYTITRHDAKGFKELVAFLGEDVFDERRQDGATAKSEAFLKMIRDARSALCVPWLGQASSCFAYCNSISMEIPRIVRPPKIGKSIIIMIRASFSRSFGVNLAKRDFANLINIYPQMLHRI